MTDEDTVRIPFDHQFRTAVRALTKTATVRLERYDVEAGDRVILTDDTGDTDWARVEVRTTFTAPASEAAAILTALNAKHALTKTENDVCDVLQPHYSDPVDPDSVVQGIVWKRVEPFPV